MINTREQVIAAYKELYPEGKLDRIIIEGIEEKAKMLGKDFEDFDYKLYGPESYRCVDFYPDGTPIEPRVTRPTVTVRAERADGTPVAGFKVEVDDYIE
ncbi:hypothetical protein [Deinococcus sp. Leaf326]|uniref:hypothetical protein n=1 Tax=Deinococcus sp. Leaf326 TaxID=1736338 RepID=UPI000AAFBCC7|nr:hypothetical protein [Deinococcus sp. Leaf326]